MGLDAIVFCNCVEQGRLRVKHPFPKQLYIRPNGAPEIRSKDRKKEEQHDRWMESSPCKHESMQADGAWLGNAARIGMIREALAALVNVRGRSNCSTLMKKVIYSGTHCGDYLTTAQVKKLTKELKLLQAIDLRAESMSLEVVKGIEDLLSELKRLSKVSIKLNKPIAF